MGNQAPGPEVWLGLGRLLERHGRTSEITVHGRSMGALFAEPTRVVVQHGISGLRRGDIIVYLLGGAAVAHRVLAVRRERGMRTFLAMGDANYQPDPPVPEAAVVGKVLAIARPQGPQVLPRRPLLALARLLWVRTRDLVPWRIRKLASRLTRRSSDG